MLSTPLILSPHTTLLLSLSPILHFTPLSTSMAETPTKRHRDDDGDGNSNIETPKRHRNSYINEQQQTTQDLLDFFTNLPSDPFFDFTQQPESDPDNNSTSDTKGESVDDDDDEKERVIRHLLEASDDELGIPSRVDGDGDGGGGGGGDDVAGGDYGEFSFDLSDGLWELEDEAANYYTLLQSELFMQ
ncbi:hypothetical protein L1987_11996 [Smallanthus sonchifolius]|uniref:Uncharacterized protein n=1 Tax=Smallanthus sonchifolius TaxID=185202 RepID=A0ACB9JEU0_9ASTR|nr:hypothetical protein L1987_11996 [Smallanthus sonchifolius]